MIKKTVLNEAHHRLGAKMLDFGGWDMPLHYGSQIEEHHAVRNACGVFDVSHMCVIDISGSQSTDFLLRLLANNVAKLKLPGKALYSVMLNEQGGVVDDLIVYGLADNFYRLVVNAGTADKDLAWMESWRVKFGDVNIRCRRDLAILAIQGPDAKQKVWEVVPHIRAATEALKPFFSVQVGDLFIANTGYTGEDGFEISLPLAEAKTLWEALLTAGVKPIGLGARDTLRLEAGMNLYGQDMDDATSPLDAGLAWTLELDTARDYIGKAALLANGQQANLLGLVLLDKGVLRQHYAVKTRLGQGEITSGTFSPTLQQSIALARVPLGVAIGDVVEVEIRGKWLNAKLVKPPFVRHGKSLL